MKLYIKNPENVDIPPKNSVNIFIDSETSTLRGKRSTGEILEFSKTIEVEPDYSNLGITVSSLDVKTGKYFIDSTGTLVEGSLNESSYSINDNQVTLTSGYTSSQSIQVGTLYSGSNELTPGTEDQTIVADTFLSNQVVFKGDANFTEENIAEGVTIWGKTGTHSGGGSIEFYKCAAVHEASAGNGYIVEGAGTAEANGTYTFSFSDVMQYSYDVYVNENNCQIWEMHDIEGVTESLELHGTSNNVCYYIFFVSNEVIQSGDVIEGQSPVPTLQKAEPSEASWDGYKYNLDTKTFADTLTEGLEYGTNLTPVVGEVYSNGCLYKLVSFITTTTNQWKQLSDDIQAGLYTTDRIGEIIEVENIALDDVGLAAGTIQFEIVAVDNASLVDTTKSHSITLFAKNVLFTKQWDGGSNLKWSNSELRTYLQNEFFNCLDSDFSAQIASVNRTHWLYGGGGEETVQDTVFLPSYTEIGFGQNQSVSEGVQWDKMTSNEARQRNQSWYWLSSASSESSDMPCFVNSSGASSCDFCYVTKGVVPALVIA